MFRIRLFGCDLTCPERLFDGLRDRLAAIALAAFRTLAATGFTTARFTITCLTTITFCHHPLLFPSLRP